MVRMANHTSVEYLIEGFKQLAASSTQRLTACVAS